MKKDAYYFAHDSNAKDDPKITLLIDQLGLEGYGIFWVLIETLRDQPEYKYPLQLLPSLARKYATTFEKIKTVVFSYNLFQVENDVFFYSKSLIERMKPLEKSREQRKNAIESRWRKEKELKQQNDTTVIRPYNESITTVIQSKEKESKEKESKLKENSENSFFFIQNEPVFIKLSEFSKQNFMQLIESQLMTVCRGAKIEKLYIDLDSNYIGYSFTDKNHVMNTIRSLLRSQINNTNQNQVIQENKKLKFLD